MKTAGQLKKEISREEVRRMVNHLRALRKLVTMSAWRERHPNRKREWDNENFDHVRQYERDYSKQNAEHRTKRMRTWRMANHERISASNKAWRLANPQKWDRIRSPEARNRQAKLARAKHPHLALKKRLQTLVAFHLIGKRGKRTMSIVGCSHQFFAWWIESLFEPGMTFENRSRWQLDHIFPVACCGPNCSQIEMAQHYRNFRPCWNHLNHQKSDKLTEESIVAAFVCGITEIHIRKPWQATDSLLEKAKRIGFNIVNHCES